MLKNNPVVGIIMGSDSDLNIMQEAANILDEFAVEYEMKIVSAHRTPNLMAEYGSSAYKRGIKVIIAGAGGAAHLPGMTASHSPLPVIGVPVATVGINQAKNAGLLAVQILAANNKELLEKMLVYKKRIEKESIDKNKKLRRWNCN